jgi:hypothetical protein
MPDEARVDELLKELLDSGATPEAGSVCPSATMTAATAAATGAVGWQGRPPPLPIVRPAS